MIIIILEGNYRYNYALGKQQANSSLLFIFLNAVLYTHEPVTTQQISQQQ